MRVEYLRRVSRGGDDGGEGDSFAFYYKTNDTKIKTHGVAGRVSKERNEAATGSDGTRHSRWIRVFFFLSGKRVFDLVFQVVCEFQSTDCRGCHSNEPISGNPWSINSCDKDWRRGPCRTGVCPVFQLPSSSSSARASRLSQASIATPANMHRLEVRRMVR